MIGKLYLQEYDSVKVKILKKLKYEILIKLVGYDYYKEAVLDRFKKIISRNINTLRKQFKELEMRQ